MTPGIPPGPDDPRRDQHEETQSLLRKLLVIAACLAVVAFMAAVFFYDGLTRPAGGDDPRPVRLTVRGGDAFSSVMDRLSGDGVLASTWAVKAYASIRGLDKKIKTGTYEFSAGERPVDILGKLVRGDVLLASVTVPEGFAIWDIAGAFQAAGVDSAGMLEALRDEGFRARRKIESPSLEGYLFPDTYLVPWDAEPAEIVNMMLSRLDEVFDQTLLQRAVEMGMNPHEVLTLASIIEAETRVPEERELVSAVYHNRLRRRMRLEADPTVAYAMGGYKGRLLYADLEIDSPYNTYRNYGLPPGPICSAGLASIRAALYPDSSSKALYFVARGDGSHIFSGTLREHRRAVNSVRRGTGN